MVGRIAPTQRDQLLELVIAVSEGQGEEAADQIEKIGEGLEEYSKGELRRRICELVGNVQHATMSQMQTGHIVMERSLLEVRRFVGKLPERVNKLLDLLSSNSLRLRVDAIDERELIWGVKKIASRIALGLVLAVLIVGAALWTQAPTPFWILGYPGLAMIFFLVAVAGGAALAGSIVVSDRKQNQKATASPSRSKLA
jgi:hypothetical protein